MTTPANQPPVRHALAEHSAGIFALRPPYSASMPQANQERGMLVTPGAALVGAPDM